MDTINRSAIVVGPGQQFLDWLHRVDPTSAHLTLEDLQREPTIYLVAERESWEQAIEYLGGKRQGDICRTTEWVVSSTSSLADAARSGHIPELV